jgi:hypothetical protein
MEKPARFKPGESYIYETANGITYARLAGAAPQSRFAVGQQYDQGPKISLRDWYDVLECSRDNVALQEAVDKCIMIYRLSKEN